MMAHARAYMDIIEDKNNPLNSNIDDIFATLIFLYNSSEHSHVTSSNTNITFKLSKICIYKITLTDTFSYTKIPKSLKLTRRRRSLLYS